MMSSNSRASNVPSLSTVNLQCCHTVRLQLFSIRVEYKISFEKVQLIGCYSMFGFWVKRSPSCPWALCLHPFWGMALTSSHPPFYPFKQASTHWMAELTWVIGDVFVHCPQTCPSSNHLILTQPGVEPTTSRFLWRCLFDSSYCTEWLINGWVDELDVWIDGSLLKPWLI